MAPGKHGFSALSRYHLPVNETGIEHGGLSRRDMIRGAAVAGAAAWTAPIIIDSLTSPAAAQSCPNPYFVAAGVLVHTAAGPPTTLTPVLPFVPLVNDLILVVTTYRGTENGASPDVSSPGYQLIASALNPVVPNLRLRVLYKVATASEGDPVVTFGGLGVGAAAAVFIYRCINPAAPFIGATATSQINATTFTAATHASTPANTLVINVVAGTLSGGASFTSVSPWAARASGASYGTTDGPQAIGVADILTTTVGAQAGSSWSTSPTTNNWVGASFALQL
jgi:hypothetical protein